MNKKSNRRNRLLFYIGICLVVSLCFYMFGEIYSHSLPKVVEVINNSAVGAILMAFVTVLLLQGQTEIDMQRDKDVKIFEEKVKVYSSFIRKMWSMLDDCEVTSEELKELRNSCFSELIFYLTDTQVASIYRILDDSDFSCKDKSIKAICEITQVLKSDLSVSEQIKIDNLMLLFTSFEHRIIHRQSKGK